MSSLNFNAANVAPAEAPEAIPAGWYIAQMVESEMKPTSNGQGAYLATVYQVLEGKYKGAKLFDRINLQNSNPTAVEIGYRQLSAICHAVGVIQVEDSAQLHNRPLGVKVSLRAAGPGADGKYYDASNEVKGYKAASAVQVENPAAATGFIQPQLPPTQFAPPPANQPNPMYGQQPSGGYNPSAQQQQWPQPPAQQAFGQQQFAQPQQPQPQQQWAAPNPQGQPQAAAMPAWANAAPVAPAQQQAAPQQFQQPAAPEQPAPTPPWAGQPAPVAQPTPAAAPAPQQAGTPTPPWVQQPQA